MNIAAATGLASPATVVRQNGRCPGRRQQRSARDRWDRDQDRAYDEQPRLQYLAERPGVKWAALFVTWVLVTILLTNLHLTLLLWVIMVPLLWYVVRAVVRATPASSRRAGRSMPRDDGAGSGRGQLQFNPAPGWPRPPRGWTPPRGWQPNPRWPRAPAGWEFWVPEPGSAERRAPGRRHSRLGPDDYDDYDDFDDRGSWR